MFPGYVRRTHNGNQHGTQRFLGHQFQQVHQENGHICLSFASCCSFHLFLSLLILVVVSCWFLLSSVSRFLPVAVYVGRLCEEQGTQHIEKKVPTQPFLRGVLASVLFPRLTWNLISFLMFFEGNKGSPGRITQNVQVLTLFLLCFFKTEWKIGSPSRPT